MKAEVPVSENVPNPTIKETTTSDIIPEGVILVTGATGRHGGTSAHTVKSLLKAGRSVRVLARTPSERTERLAALGTEIVYGDFNDRRSMMAALDGVTTATFTYPVAGGIVPAAAAFASAIRARNAPLRLVVMSMGVAHPDSPSHLGRAQWLAEEIFSWAGLDLCILRVAALFLENIVTLHADSIRAKSEFANNFGNVNTPWIAGIDAANLLTAAILHPERFKDQIIHYPPGAELCSHDTIAGILSEVLDRPIRFKAISQDEWTEQLLAIAAREPGQVINTDMAKHIPAVGAALAATKTPIRLPDAAELERLTNQKPVSVRAFLQTNRDRFRP